MSAFGRQRTQLKTHTLNATVIRAVQDWLKVHPMADRDDAPLFLSRKGGALGVSSVNHMMKLWCANVGLRENYGSHTLRKTRGYHQLRQAGAPIPLLMEAYGHATQRQTLEYLCIQNDEIRPCSSFRPPNPAKLEPKKRREPQYVYGTSA